MPHILIHQTFKSLKFMVWLDSAHTQKKSGRKNSPFRRYIVFPSIGRSIILILSFYLRLCERDKFL